MIWRNVPVLNSSSLKDIRYAAPEFVAELPLPSSLKAPTANLSPIAFNETPMPN